MEQTLWTFAVFGDSQGDNRGDPGKECVNEKTLGIIADKIAEEHPDFVLVTGDLVNGWFRNGGMGFDAQFAQWKSVMGPVYASTIPVYPVRGNHENGPERLALPPIPPHFEPPPGADTLLKASFRKAFTKEYIPLNGPPNEENLTYSFVHKNACIVGLDQFSGGQHRIHQVWLDKRLSANKAPHVFVFSHEPAFEVQHIDNMSFFEKERDAFWDSIGKAGCRAYFCGHDHLYDRSLIPDGAGNPIRQIVAGTGGRRLTSWKDTHKETKRVVREYTDTGHHGYVFVTVDGPRVTVVWKGYTENTDGISWRTYDSFSYRASSETSIPTTVKKGADGPFQSATQRRKMAHGY